MFEVSALLSGRIGVRHWIAWQLIQIAWYIYHDDFEDEITLLAGDTEVARWAILSDTWGHGLISQFVRPGLHYTVRHRVLDEDGVVIDENPWAETDS